jgi:hypothetical protein
VGSRDGSDGEVYRLAEIWEVDNGQEVRERMVRKQLQCLAKGCQCHQVKMEI